MESLIMEQKVIKFLDNGHNCGSGLGSGYGYTSSYSYVSGGYGCGYNFVGGKDDGSGYGHGCGGGCGDGLGDGSGDGYGSGSGSGSAFGNGRGYGDGIKSINGQQVYIIDGIPTLIDVCHETYAMGRILYADLTTEKCFIVKQDGKFAHGKTLREARDALLEKLFDDMPEEERIEKFMELHKLYAWYPNRDFFSWHHRLTGSCLQGRTAFAKDHGIDLDGSMTTKEFLELTKDSYGGDIIRRTILRYNEA